MLRRVWTVMLACLLVVGLVSACGGSSGSGATATTVPTTKALAEQFAYDMLPFIESVVDHKPGGSLVPIQAAAGRSERRLAADTWPPDLKDDVDSLRASLRTIEHADTPATMLAGLHDFQRTFDVVAGKLGLPQLGPIGSSV